MNVVFRTDASIQIGTGHVMRCLTLANAMRLRGANCTFVCRSHEGNLLSLIRKSGYRVLPLAKKKSKIAENITSLHAEWLGTDWMTDASETQHALDSLIVDWLVVDHYALDYRWEQVLRPLCQKLMVIDDLADRIHNCDLLLDQNLGRSEDDYSQLVPPYSVSLIGPRYALLRPEFTALREESLARRKLPHLKKLLITMGGVDRANVTEDVLETLQICNLPTDLEITVVMGPHAPWLKRIKDIAKTMPQATQVLVNVDNMARVMTDSDLVIGAAGGTAWESCSLGLPSLVTVLADNQTGAATALKNQGASLVFENVQHMGALINRLLTGNNTTRLLQRLSNNASAITQGNGTYLVSSALDRFYV